MQCGFRLLLPQIPKLVLRDTGVINADDSLWQGLEHVTHALVVGGDDGDQIQLREHEDELPACAATLDVVIGLSADREVIDPPKEAVVLIDLVRCGVVARTR